MKAYIERLSKQEKLTQAEFAALLDGRTQALASDLFARAVQTRRHWYGDQVYIRGLIEFTNYCKNDCYYCGIRCSNKNAQRYRLTPEEILECCRQGYELGYRTFVLQGGEDPGYSPEKIEALVRAIKQAHPDCAVTLSVGEHPQEVYERWFHAGADRYLLRHETANEDHYAQLHPQRQTLRSRMDCLKALKEIGYQVGCGFMVGSPGQTTEHLANDLCFLQEFRPHMVGIGPFIPHKDTPFAEQSAGSLELTLFLLGIVRLMLPNVLLPATTALGSIHPQGRELGILAGANVCMPNLSPTQVRDKYALYNNKASLGAEAAQGRKELERRLEAIGCHVVTHRGDWKPDQKGKGSDYYV